MSESPLRIKREDVALRTTDEGPALEIGDTEILLRTFVRVENDEKPLGDETLEPGARIDCDGDNGCWWDLVPDDSDYPWVTIQPEVRSRKEDNRE